MAAVSNLVLSAVMTVTSSLDDGLQDFQKKRYEAAISNLTVTATSHVLSGTLQSVALLYRARAYRCIGNTNAAVADIRNIIGLTEEETLVRAARGLFKELGRKETELLPEVGPKIVWQRYIDALRANDGKKAGSLVTDQIAGMMRQWMTRAQMNAGVGGLEQYGLSMGNYQVMKEEIGIGPDAGKAWLTMSYAGGHMNVAAELECVLRKNEWKLSMWNHWGRGAVRPARHTMQVESKKVADGEAAKRVAIPEDLRAKVADLVKKLRSGQSTARRGARNDLVLLGTNAVPAIREYLNDVDPEVSESIRAIVDRLE